ncbi:MAG: HAMP domain-containing histidine kinase [Oscillospiraceae bacterium]|nr:HAMP domain-containing histidine kinase [Oscillospiraceae bacterium]
MNDPKIKAQTIIHIIITAVGFAVCMPINIPCAVILLCTSLSTLFISLHYHKKRSMTISELSEKINKILNGIETVSFSDYNEGELSALSSDIYKMTVKLREQNSMLSKDKKLMQEAMEDISHQLRTPLTSMLLILNMLRKPDLEKSRQREYIRELYELSDRCTQLIETLLGISRLEAGAVTFRSTDISCRRLILSAAEPLSVAYELKNVELITDIVGDPHLYGDMSYCTEALTNILKNCLEHTPEGSSVTVRAEENAIYTGITITDSGAGIPENELPHIFERFYRSDELSKSGYGIGLAFAHKIIAAQNGNLQVKNADKGGAMFDMRIYKSTSV